MFGRFSLAALLVLAACGKPVDASGKEDGSFTKAGMGLPQISADDPGRPQVARVVVDVPLAHLDRPFDYAVPEKLADTVRAGCRVRVRFSGQLVDGFVLELGETTGFTGKLMPLAHVPSGEPVLTPQVARLLRTIADRYAGTMSDVLRLAVPPRRAAAAGQPRVPGAAAHRGTAPGHGGRRRHGRPGRPRYADCASRLSSRPP